MMNNDLAMLRAIIAGNIQGYDKGYANAEATLELIRKNIAASYESEIKKLAA